MPLHLGMRRSCGRYERLTHQCAIAAVRSWRVASAVMIRRTDNAHVFRRGERRFSAHDSILRSDEEPPLASHLVTPRALYTHHGIYVGNGRVIHYAGLAYRWRRGPVEDVSLQRFAHGHGIRVRRDAARFDPVAVVERARSRLGERGYRLLTNNCEHFCAWALCDESRSTQVDRLRAVPRAIQRAGYACCRRVVRHLIASPALFTSLRFLLVRALAPASYLRAIDSIACASLDNTHTLTPSR